MLATGGFSLLDRLIRRVECLAEQDRYDDQEQIPYRFFRFNHPLPSFDVYIIRHTVDYSNRVLRIFRTGSVFF